MANIVTKAVGDWAKKKALNTIAAPLDNMVDENLSDITTTIGSFIIRSVRGKFQRSISFTIGVNPADYWMEEALYGILYKYNDIKGKSKLEMTNKRGIMDGSSLYCRLDDGTHNLKFRKWDILLFIQTRNPQTMAGRVNSVRTYTIITYELSPEFVDLFEKDMVAHRNALLKIKANAPTINVYKDYHENDGFTYWEKMLNIPKRKLSSLYLPYEQKKKLVDTINTWFASKEFYHAHGIPWNLKILLYGAPGPQPYSIGIPTPDGIKKFGDLKVGDEVFAYNGLPTKILDVIEFGEMDVYEITFNDGRKTLCSYNHRWPTISSKGNIAEKTVEDMLKDGLFTNGYPNYCIPLSSEAKFKNKELEIDPWVMGAFIGNDSLSEYYLTISSIDTILPRYIASKIHATAKKVNDGTHNWNFYRNDIPIKTKEFFYDYPILRSYPFNRTIPRNYMLTSADNRYALLRGLNATMKGCKENDITFSTTSEKLKDDIIFIIHSLGYTASWFIDENRYNIRMNTNEENLHILKIEKLDRRENMRCIHVEDSMHLYQTNNFITTCNCGKDSTAKVIASEWNRNIYMCTGGKNGKFIPNAITDESIDVNSPLYVISDIDKYPSIINEPDTSIDEKDGAKEEALIQKQIFGNMLNALDGIMSGEGRIIIMTTNHIEKFSEAFLRPGRVDLCMEIGCVTAPVFRRYIKDFYNVELPKNIELNRDDLTMSELQRDVVFMKLSADEITKKYVK